MATTFCVDIVEALVDVLEAQQTATPTLLRKVFPSRPGAFQELPCAWVDPGAEDITHDAGTRTRTFSGLTVTVVDNYSTESGPDRLNQLRDYLCDRFSAAVSAVPGTILEQTSAIPGDIEVPGTAPDGTPRSTFFRSIVFGFGRTFVKEGRQ